MNNAIAVKVLETLHNLIHDLTHPLFTQVETELLEVSIEVATLHVFEYNVIVEAVFKEVNEFDDIRVLAHLKHLNLFHLLEHLYATHPFLCHLLHCKFLAVLVVGR